MAPSAVDLAKLAQTAEKLIAIKDELCAIFPERETLLNQILFALVTKEHVLVTGTFGTGKSDLLQTLFHAFTGAEIFSIGLTKFMSESAIIGLPNPKRMQEEGEIWLNRDGGILNAQFVELDELFDANGPLLRTLLTILNERQFKRGRQNEKAHLHTAVAATNGDPEAEVKKDPSLGAVIDRFIFQCQVHYLLEEDSRQRMYRKYLTGAKPTVQITYQELDDFAKQVVDANQITDPDFVAVYDRILQKYRSAFSTDVVSDRRACKLLKLCEANALLHGRWEVVYEDILAVRWGLCKGDPVKMAKFEELARPIIQEAALAKQQNVDEVQIKLLEALEQRIPKRISAQLGAQDMIDLKRELRGLQLEIEQVRPTLASTQEIKREHLERLKVQQEKVEKMINGDV